MSAADAPRIRIELAADTDAVVAAAAARRFALAHGASARASQELAIVVAELASNALKYAGGGSMSVSMGDDGRLLVEALDRGPGIADPALALVDGVSEGRRVDQGEAPDRRGLGAGLGAVRRLTDTLVIEPRVGGGTRVLARKRLR